MQCGNARLLSSGSFGLLNELNLNNSVSLPHPTSNQLKACFCARSGTSASSLVFPTLTLVRAILLQADKAVNNRSFFQIQLSSWHFHPQALSSFFRNFISKVHDAAGFLWTSNLYLLLRPVKTC